MVLYQVRHLWYLVPGRQVSCMLKSVITLRSDFSLSGVKSQKKKKGAPEKFQKQHIRERSISVTSLNMSPTAETIQAVEVDPDIYGQSGDADKHAEGVKKQYDTKEKLEFYAQVMGDGACVMFALLLLLSSFANYHSFRLSNANNALILV